MFLAMLTALSCAPKADHDALTAQVEALEKRVGELEARPSGGSAGPSAADEAAAGEMYGEVLELIATNKPDEAKKKLDVLMKDYGSTKTAARGIRTKQELAVVGKKVDTPSIEKWFVGGEGDLDLSSGTTLVVFWEIWCPHCKREVPELQATWESYNSKGLKMVGLTKISKSATEEKVVEFIGEQGVTYPMAKEGECGAASKAFNVSGIPAAAVVKDGTIVWRGHPGRLSEELLNELIGS